MWGNVMVNHQKIGRGRAKWAVKQRNRLGGLSNYVSYNTCEEACRKILAIAIEKGVLVVVTSC